jgi:hypothetical protein
MVALVALTQEAEAEEHLQQVQDLDHTQVDLELQQQLHHLLLVFLHVQLSSIQEEVEEELTNPQHLEELVEKAAEAEAEIDTQEDLDQNKG